MRVVAVGDGPAGLSLRRALPRVTFLGERHGAQLSRLYASFDLFVHAGPFETFGQAVQEAMASGLPVVAVAAAVAELAADEVKRKEYGADGDRRPDVGGGRG